MKPEFKSVGYRRMVVPSDTISVTHILKSTGLFKPQEIEVAVDLVEVRLKNGEGCGYQFLFLEIEGRSVAFGCYGEIPCTSKNYSLYWIAVENNYRGKGLGQNLLEKIESDIKSHSGRGIYVETSTKEQFAASIAFYEKCDYQLQAVIDGFYDLNNHKAIHYKKL
jgi:ribosomal protein S18 acetylase RimI-like enzyme